MYGFLTGQRNELGSQTYKRIFSPLMAALLSQTTHALDIACSLSCASRWVLTPSATSNETYSDRGLKHRRPHVFNRDSIFVSEPVRCADPNHDFQRVDQYGCSNDVSARGFDTQQNGQELPQCWLLCFLTTCRELGCTNKLGTTIDANTPLSQGQDKARQGPRLCKAMRYWAWVSRALRCAPSYSSSSSSSRRFWASVTVYMMIGPRSVLRRVAVFDNAIEDTAKQERTQSTVTPCYLTLLGSVRLLEAAARLTFSQTPSKVAELAQLKSESPLCLLRAEIPPSIVGVEDRLDQGRTPRPYANGSSVGRLGSQAVAVDFAALLKASHEPSVSPPRRPQPVPAFTYQQLPHKIPAASPRPVAHAAPPAPVAPTQMSGRRGMPPHTGDQPPVKKQSKWSPEEDALIIELRGKGMKWEDISKRLPGRSAISCRLHYQNYLERRSEWDEERKNKLARLYERFKPEMWAKVAEEMAVPWRAAEAMHWQLGEADMARRAGVIPFSLAAVNVEGNNNHRSSPSRSHIHSHSQGSMPRDLGMPSPRVVYNRAPPMPPASNRAIISRRESIPPPPPLPMGPEPAEVQYVPGPGLAPIQNQPTPRSAGMLPGFAELTGGVSPYSTASAVPSMGPVGVMGQGPLYSSLASYSIESAGSKRRASPDPYQYEPNQRRRIA
ncbi:hypothetical protein HYE68_005542 [Fusarium pseudograminearum]|nr:hypothetical protein HYE68_005542 [Fusarium pseudograminearum]